MSTNILQIYIMLLTLSRWESQDLLSYGVGGGTTHRRKSTTFLPSKLQQTYQGTLGTQEPTPWSFTAPSMVL